MRAHHRYRDSTQSDPAALCRTIRSRHHHETDCANYAVRGHGPTSSSGQPLDHLRCFLLVLCSRGRKPIPQIFFALGSGCALSSIIDAPSIRLVRARWVTVSKHDEVFLSRFKLGLGLVLVAGVVILIAVAYLNRSSPSHAVNEPDRTTTVRWASWRRHRDSRDEGRGEVRRL